MLHIERDYGGDSQLASFQNGTFQIVSMAGYTFAVSIGTYLEPEVVPPAGLGDMEYEEAQELLVESLRDHLKEVQDEVGGLTFRVAVGPEFG